MTQWKEIPDEDRGGKFFQFKQFGDSFTGTFMAERTDNSGQYGPQTVFDFAADPTGEIFTIKGSGGLKFKLAKVKRGDMVRITYTGDKDVGKQSPMKEFKVEIASHDAAPPPAQRPAVNGSAPF